MRGTLIDQDEFLYKRGEPRPRNVAAMRHLLRVDSHIQAAYDVPSVHRDRRQADVQQVLGQNLRPRLVDVMRDREVWRSRAEDLARILRAPPEEPAVFAASHQVPELVESDTGSERGEDLMH
jgi:hypothetical protein